MKVKIASLINVLLLSALILVFPLTAAAQDEHLFTLDDTIQSAVSANIDLKISKQEIEVAEAQRKSSRAAFLPSFSVAYQYERYDEELSSRLAGVTRPINEYTFAATVTQPIFTGFAILNQYKLADLGLDIAKLNSRLVHQEVVLAAQQIYFTVLKTQKIFKVAEDTVTQLTAHTEVAKNFYEVGMTPLNDYLQAQVELANAEQNRVVAQNGLEIAEANFNTLLRRGLHEPVVLEDILTYTPVDESLADYFEEAYRNRIEIEVADLDIAVAEKNIKLAQKSYWPSVSVEGTYYEIGNDWDLTGTVGVSDPDGWSITAAAQWTLWDWGKSYYNVKEKRHRLIQSQRKKESLLDQIALEVKDAYLKTQETEKNIITIKKAIEQAQENFRINQERYKEQVATSTDVLDAQTLLTRTMVNYYGALYDFKIAKAQLERAMGRQYTAGK